MMPGAVVVLSSSAEWPPEAQDVLCGLGPLRLAGTAHQLSAALEGADVVYLWDYRLADLLEASWPAARDVRWIQVSGVGVDGVLIPPVLDGDVAITNTPGIQDEPIAEYVMTFVLLFAKDVLRTLALQADERWEARPTELVSGRTMVILGAGGVARAIGSLARGMGMRVQAIARSERTDPDLGRVRALADLDDLLAGADVLTLALPLTAQTRGILDADRLARLKPGARIVNVGRGSLIDEDALIAALRAGRVDAAALDVCSEEPLPAGHPLWSMQRVVVSPHMAGYDSAAARPTLEAFAANVRRWRAGEPLQHQVDARAAAT